MALSKSSEGKRRGANGARSQGGEEAPEYESDNSVDEANLQSNMEEDDPGPVDRYGDSSEPAEAADAAAGDTAADAAADAASDAPPPEAPRPEAPLRQANLKDIGLSSSDESDDEAFGADPDHGREEGAGASSQPEGVGHKRKWTSDEDEDGEVAGQEQRQGTDEASAAKRRAVGDAADVAELAGLSD